ncbi:o-succinylbenzoate synthase [invertebrate metagenome]|uniref:O-succinylbenzoate synthase n=1 Tax=invertebrate metagenome TaxID=1711999 RepID=A0A2H9TAT0_9ZZZZ
MTTVERARIFQYAFPLRYPLPLKSSRITARQGLILELTDNQGVTAYGEASPLPDFSQESLAASRSLLIKTVSQLVENHWGTGYQHPWLLPVTSVAFAIESALWGLNLAQYKQSPETAPLLTGTSYTINKRLSSWPTPFPREFKFKVGRQPLHKDIEQVMSILGRLPSSSKLRLDANQHWNPQQLIDFSKAIDVHRIAYIEEPVPKSNIFPELFRRTGIYYALDESLQHYHPIQMMSGLRALIIKPTLTGGLHYCHQLIRRAKQQGIRAVLSSSFESPLGIHVLQQLAAHWLPDEMAGLDTLTAFHSDCPLFSLPSSGCPFPDHVIKQLDLICQFPSH